MQLELFHRTAGNRVEFLIEGDQYYALFLELIHTAKRSIHLQTYIFELDAFGSEVHAALIAAAARGVKVYLMVDGIGSLRLDPKREQELMDGGVHFCRFSDLQFKWIGQWGRRLHHKALLADHQRAIIGGINVISDYRSGKAPLPQLDFALYLEGPATVDLAKYCQQTFKRAYPKEIEFNAVEDSGKKAAPGAVDVKISINDWVYRRWQITRHYTHLTDQAKSEIIIANSYFFPRQKFMRQLAEASKRGVKVTLILPKFSDWPSYVQATQYLYNFFFKNGIEIYQWKKSIMHGKLAIIDNNWATVGSFNLNYTSYQQNLEMNVDVLTQDFVVELKKSVRYLIATGCEKIEPEEFLKHATLKVRAKRFFYYLVLALVANFSIGIAFQEDKKRSRAYKVLLVTASLFFLILGIVGIVLPLMPGIPFFIIAFLLVYRQILFNNRNV